MALAGIFIRVVTIVVRRQAGGHRQMPVVAERQHAQQETQARPTDRRHCLRPMQPMAQHHHRRARQRYYKRTFLKEDAEGALLVNGVRYLETGEETNTIGIFFRFDEAEANGITIREYGFFGGDVQYVQSVTGDLAMGGVFHQDTNPTGEVLRPGYLYEVKNIPDFNKISDTRVELVGIIKI